MIRPVLRRFSGNKRKAAQYIKESDKQMQIMENDMRFRSLAQYKRTIVLSNGVVIICTSNHGIRKILIHHPTIEEMTKYTDHLKCFCNCSFSIGIVIGPSESILYESYPSKNLRLDVIVCNREYKFVRFNDCLGSDFTRYSTAEGEAIPTEDQYGSEEGWGFDERPWEGEPVILMLDNGRPIDDFLNCCSSAISTWHENNGISVQKACSPASVAGGLSPTFRVVPMIAIDMPRIMDSWKVPVVPSETVVHYNG